MAALQPLQQFRAHTQEDLHFKPKQLRHLPAELRLKIFRFVFDASFSKNYCVLLERDSGRLWFVESQVTRRTCPYLNSRLVGQDVATEAAEAFYQSGIILFCYLSRLLDILERCPLSSNAAPGRCITRLALLIDEDVEYSGDNSGRHSLRKADWVLLDDQDHGQMLPSRTQLMRCCFRAVLKMPKLKVFGIWIIPADEWKPKDMLWLWEMRDFVPIIFRLRARGIDARAHIQVMMPLARYSDGTKAKVHPVNGIYHTISTVDVSMCFPFCHPTKTGLSDHGGIVDVCEGVDWTHSLSSSEAYLRRRNRDALRKLFHRLAADKRLEYVNGDFRRIVKKGRKRGQADLGFSEEQAQRKARQS